MTLIKYKNHTKWNNPPHQPDNIGGAGRHQRRVERGRPVNHALEQPIQSEAVQPHHLDEVVDWGREDGLHDPDVVEGPVDDLHEDLRVAVGVVLSFADSSLFLRSLKRTTVSASPLPRVVDLHGVQPVHERVHHVLGGVRQYIPQLRFDRPQQGADVRPHARVDDGAERLHVLRARAELLDFPIGAQLDGVVDGDGVSVWGPGIDDAGDVGQLDVVEALVEPGPDDARFEVRHRRVVGAPQRVARDVRDVQGRVVGREAPRVDRAAALQYETDFHSGNVESQRKITVASADPVEDLGAKIAYLTADNENLKKRVDHLEAGLQILISNSMGARNRGMIAVPTSDYFKDTMPEDVKRNVTAQNDEEKFADFDTCSYSNEYDLDDVRGYQVVFRNSIVWLHQQEVRMGDRVGIHVDSHVEVVHRQERERLERDGGREQDDEDVHQPGLGFVRDVEQGLAV
ncbi:hypothetical protein FAVG1_13082 [Fusarium avenaceum]|nr:hypothetical protein FAVG1_13082 [Fusarium avenaceum]